MALLTSFTVDGVEVARTRLRDNSLTYDNQINGRSVLECVLVDKTLYPSSPYIPTVRDTVYLEIGGTPVFGGILWAQRVGNIAGPGRGVQTQATFTDYKALLDRVYFNGLIPAGSLASQLAVLIANMAPHGITLSGSQEAGPAMGAQGFDFKTIRQCLDALSEQTVLTGSTWIYTISPTGVFRMYEAGTQAAPFALSETVGNYRSASWSLDLNSYVNEMYDKYGPAGLVLISQTFTGDNSTSTFALSLPLVIAATGVAPSGYVTVTRAGPALTNENIDAEPVTGPAMWHYDAVTNTLIQDDAQPILDTGETVLISYYVQGPFILFERDDPEYAAFGPFTDVLVMPEITDPAIAQTTLEADLARRLGLPKKLTVLTDEPGAEPFQTVTCTMPSLAVSGDFLITEVSLVEVTVNANGQSGVREFAFELQCIEGNRYRGNWEVFWRPEPRTSGTGQFPYTPPPSGADGCVGVPIIHEAYWEGAEPDSEWINSNPSNLELATGVSGNGVQRIDRAGIDILDITLETFVDEHQTGCVEFYFRSDGGDATGGGALFDLYNEDAGIGPGGASPWVRLHRDTGETAILSVSTTGVGIVWTWTSSAGFYSTTAFRRLRIEYGLSTYDGVNYALDGYVRLYRDGVLVVSTSGLDWHADGATWAGAGLTYERLQVPGTIDSFVQRGMAGGVGSPSVSPSASTSPSHSASPSSSASASVSPSAGNSPSVSPSVSASVSPSSSASASTSPSASLSPSSSVSRSASASVSPSASSSRSVSPSASVSPSVSPSPSPSVSPSAGAGFPEVLERVRTANAGNGTSHVLSMPTGTANGDLLTAIVTSDGVPTITVGSGTGWTKLGQTNQGSSLCCQAIFWKVADGVGDNLTVALTASETVSAIVLRTPSGTFGTPSGIPVTGTAASSGGANGDPPNHTPPGGAKNYLWIVTNGGDDARTVSAAPTNYDELTSQLGVSGGCGTATAQRELNASSENPGAWTSSLSGQVLYTLAIEPV